MSAYHAIPSTTNLNDQDSVFHEFRNDEKFPSIIVQPVPIDATDAKDDAPAQSLAYRRSVYINKKGPKPLVVDQFIKACKCQSPFVKACMLTVITGIPFMVFLLVALSALPNPTYLGPSGSKATLVQLAKWLIISWASFMGLIWCGKLLAIALAWCCSLSRGTVKYQRLAEAICIRMVLMFWAIICYAVIPSIFHHSLGSEKTVDTWVQQLQKAFRFIIIAFAIIVVQGIVLELSSIQYIQGWMGPRSQRASDELDTVRQLYELTNPHLTAEHAGYVSKFFKKLLLPINDEDLHHRLTSGQGEPELWTLYANHLWDCISQRKSSINRFDIDQQLRAMNRDPARGQDLFVQLDDSCDGEVTFEEVEKLVQRVGIQLNTRAQCQHGINSLLRKLEILLSVVMAGIIFFIYIQFFEAQYSKDLGTFWTGLTGLSFAFGGVLLEFSNACVFVFGKHPYDVGDYVESKGKKLVVQKIFLTHTNFEEVTDPEERGVVVQMSHASLMAEPIVNWTRTLEVVVQKRKSKTDEEKAKDKSKAEDETKANEDVRSLILLKTEHLKSLQERE